MTSLPQVEKPIPEPEVPPARKTVRHPGKIHPPLMALIDVMFTLMLYFLVASHARANEGQLPTSLPNVSAPAAAQAQVPLPEIRLKLRPTGDGLKVTYFMDASGVGIDTEQVLYERLMARQAQITADAPVIIEAGDDVRWEFLVAAFNQAVRARFKNIAFTAAE